MLQLVSPMAVLFDWSMVFCAVLVGFFAAVVSIKLFRWAQDQGNAGQTFAVLIASGVTGCGIWSSQLVILAAYRPDLTLSYNVAFLLVSLLVAGILSATGIAVAA
jgi:NO-binding membrane sensor protein with MHYT domain